MEVAAIMTRAVVSVSPTDSVARAWELLDDLEIRHLPVIENHQLVGILSDRDLREVRSPRAMETPVSQIMTTNVLSVEDTESLRAAIDTMLEYKVSALPVVNSAGQLQGILSYVDILRTLRPESNDE